MNSGKLPLLSKPPKLLDAIFSLQEKINFYLLETLPFKLDFGSLMMEEGDGQGFKLVAGDPVVTSETPAQFLKSRKGSDVLIDCFNFEYLLDKDAGGRRYWYCRSRKTSEKCMATAITIRKDPGHEVILSTTKHSHFADPSAMRVKKTYRDILETAEKHPEIRTADLMTKWCQATSYPEARGQAIKFKSVERAIQKKRASTSQWADLPDQPEFSELQELPDFAMQTSDGQQFLQVNESTENGSRIMIYASPFGLSLLGRAEIWSGDGTFDKAPVPFSQIYSVLALLEGQSYPAAFCFLPDKRGPTYKFTLNKLKELVQEHFNPAGGDIPLKLMQFNVDFEAAIVKEIRLTFGKDINVSGCWVHMKRNLWAHARSLPYLQSYFCHSEVFATFLKSFGALAFLPIPEVDAYYERIMTDLLKDKVLVDLEGYASDGDPNKEEEVEGIKKSIDDFISYFEATYLGRETRTGRASPMYPIKVWSQYQNLMDGNICNTNPNEALHSNMQHLIPPHSSIWKVVNYLKNLESKVKVKRDEHIQYNKGQRDYRDKHRAELEDQIRNLVEHRNEYLHSEFLRRLGSLKDLSNN